MTGLRGENRDDVVRLKPLEEIRGRLEAVEHNGFYLDVILSSGVLRVPADSREAEICRKKLEQYEGDWFAILRTSLPESPFIIRQLPDIKSRQAN